MFDNASSLARSSIGKPLQVFRHRPFLIFWIGACVSNTGNWTENAAQSWAVTTQTVGNPHQGLLVEVLQFADFCPVLLLALLAGVISDRVNRKVWLITLQASACALGAGLAAAAFLGRATPWVVIVFTFLEGIIWALNGPVFLSVVPSLVPRAELDRALALNSVQFNMARLCGPMLAAVLIGAIGVAGAFTFNACTFLPLLIALLVAIPSTPAPSRPKAASIYDDIREGLKFVWTTPGTRRLTTHCLGNRLGGHNRSLSPAGLILRYIDAVEFDYQSEDVFAFLRDKMRASIGLPGELFSPEAVLSKPLNFAWQTTFQCKKPGGVVVLNFDTGQRENKPVLRWETMVVSLGGDVPELPKDFDTW